MVLWSSYAIYDFGFTIYDLAWLGLGVAFRFWILDLARPGRGLGFFGLTGVCVVPGDGQKNEDLTIGISWIMVALTLLTIIEKFLGS